VESLVTRPIEPAYAIPASDDELRLIGELCAIQGQIEYLMQNAVQQILQTDQKTTLKILGSTSIGTNVDIWCSVIKTKCKLPPVIEVAERVNSEIGTLAQGRNDFVHALFATGNFPVGGGFSLISGAKPVGGTPVAVRSKTGKQRALSEIQGVRDTAARLSCAMAHINYCIMMGADGPTPYSGKF
jgi:hypothetical protein